MTPANNRTDRTDRTDRTGPDGLSPEVDQLLRRLTRQASAHDQEKLRRALRAEVERREVAAYAHGWQDAMASPARLTR